MTASTVPLLLLAILVGAASGRDVINSCNETSSFGQVLLRIDGLGTFEAVCVQRHRLFGDGWLVIQQRVDQSEDFYRNWAHYRAGFGRLDKNFWMGLERVHRLTSADPHELAVEIDVFGEYKYARYSSFAVGSEAEKYVLNEVGNYSGTAKDALTVQRGRAFSTFDEDNDLDENKNCAIRMAGGWWFAGSCSTLSSPETTVCDLSLEMNFLLPSAFSVPGTDPVTTVVFVHQSASSLRRLQTRKINVRRQSWNCSTNYPTEAGIVFRRIDERDLPEVRRSLVKWEKQTNKNAESGARPNKQLKTMSSSSAKTCVGVVRGGN
ncbi:conserved hypothetical protein [Culex quinquefasciatus]|uniref:Fibrinogen C-terminal domain-containing protein n=1 Tax=Culex quinquefasciatus TaxID=7176 RepID=B0XJ58_CULQU|nr:conserved hypothetical protein [Culex quinquefasciatus]|eukprot:XP_001869680.1 conserved hypothetical protein [Culex quinquefasciatus]